MPPIESLGTAGTPATKFRPPRVRHAELTRSAILDDPRIGEAEILAINAPAGFGKSTLAIQWASRSQHPVVWVTCDATDSDPLVLMTTLAGCFAHSVPEYVAPPRALTLEEPAYARRVLPDFERSVTALDAPVTMVVDDTHLVAEEQALQVLRRLVNALPAGSRIAFAGRSLHGLPVPLWRGQGRLVDVTARHLAFDLAATRAALSSFTNAAVGESEARRVHTITQGWPVAVFLLSQFGGARELSSIEEFIETEVLAPMAEDLRAFVCETAALGTVNVDLARATTGQRRAAHFLGEAITTVLLQETSDDWYRYHPLLQECATAVMEREDPDRLQVVRSKAAVWHLDHGHLETSVHYAAASGDLETMGTVFWPAARMSLVQGRTAAVKGWLEAAGERATIAVPQLSITAAWASMAASDFGNVLRHTVATLQHMPPDWRAHLHSSDVAPHLAMLLAVTGYGLAGPQEAADLAEAALATLDSDDPTRALAGLILGLNLGLVGDPRATQAMRQAAALAQAAGIASTEVEALSMLGLLQMIDGDDSSGCRTIEEARSAFAFHDLAEMASTAGVLTIAQVAWAAFRGRPTDTTRAIADLDTIRPSLEPVFPWFHPLAGGVCAFASVKAGDLAGFRRYVAWCDDPDGPGGALSRHWATRARQEYAAASPLQHLSPAELRVWELLKGRMTLSEIADTLFLSRETVKSHTVSIYRKLGVASRREAQDLAESWG